MNIFDLYLEKIIQIINTAQDEGLLKLPDKLNGINVRPIRNVVIVRVSPLQFFRKTESTFTKSARRPPIFLISPLKTIFP